MNEPLRVRRPARSLLGATVVAAISVAMAAFRFRIWSQSFSVPLMTAGTDDLQIAAIVRSIRETGWYFTNPDLGAPFGQQLYDFPHAGESLQILALRVLTLFSVRPYWAMNVYFIAGFAALAFVTYLVLAHMRFRFGTAAVVSLLYTWLPYHFMHGQFHLFRSAYLSAPLGVLLIFWVLSWKDRFLVDPAGAVWGPRRLAGNLRWPRVWAAVGVCAFIGVFETMTMAFVLVAMVFSALVSTIRNRDIGDLVGALVAGVLIAATFAVAFLPNYQFKADNGGNEAAGARYPSEQITYGLQISKMVLPVADHDIGALARLLPRSQDHSPTAGESGQNLGMLGAVGLLVLLYGAVANRLDTRAGREVWNRHRLWVQAGLVTIVTILFATMSGFALVLSVLGFSQIRVWNRAVVLIAFCSMLMVAIGLEKIVAALRRRFDSWAADRMSGRARRVGVAGVSALLLVAVAVFGLWDTDVSYASSRSNAWQDRRARVLMNLDEQIVDHFGDDAMLFQLPVIPYPEAPSRNDMLDYEGLLPYLYSDGLRFSYGATRGRRDADWQVNKVDNNDPGRALPGLRGLGFDAILVDTHGYGDRGAVVTEQLGVDLGPPVIASIGGRWLVWDLRGIAETLDLSEADLQEAATALVGRRLMAELPDR